MRALVCILALGFAAILRAQLSPPPVPEPPAVTPIDGASAAQVTAVSVQPGSSAPSVEPPPPITPSVENVSPVVMPSGETTLQLDIGFGFRYVPPARVTVPAGEQLRVYASVLGPTVTWYRNEQPIPGATSNPLIIREVTASDAGHYNARSPAGQPSQQLFLGVGPVSRLVNLSARTLVGANEPYITGFVVNAETASSSKKILVRVIGPALATFGVTDFLKEPRLAIYDGSGREYTNQYVYPAVVGGPTYESDLADALNRTGAFPIPSSPTTRDITTLRPFVPGSYTLHVRSGDGTAGVVLVEIYEVP